MSAPAMLDDDRFEAHRRPLFGLCYRMTGSAADAEDLVQATFERALSRPPADLDAPLRPWLFTVATRLCVDALRRRARERYFGPWLPAPVETDRIRDDLEPGPEARYGTLESASIAFLMALEALDPRQRAVVVLRDVVGMSGPETAEALETSPGNVRVILHRARKALEGYDAARRPVTPELRARTEAALQRLLTTIASGDVEATVALLAEDVESLHDGGGEYVAAVRPVRGAREVAELYRNIAAHSPVPPRWLAVGDYNGLPAIVAEYGDRGRYAPRALIALELDARGRAAKLRVVVSPAKLHAVRFPDAPADAPGG